MILYQLLVLDHYSLKNHLNQHLTPSKNRSLGKVKGYRRIFAHAAPIFFERGIANTNTKEYSSLSTEESENDEILVVVFDIDKNELEAFYQREIEFRWIHVRPYFLDDTPMTRDAIMCAKYSDEEYRRERCNDETFYKQYGRWGIQKIWDDTLFPCRLYLRHCVLAARKLGKEVEDNFLDHTYLGDRMTTVRVYLEENPDIMLEVPPDHLIERYSG